VKGKEFTFRNQSDPFFRRFARWIKSAPHFSPERSKGSKEQLR
jgi:hypothetical protein